MGKRSVIKLLITNSRGKNSGEEFTRAPTAAGCIHTRACGRVNKIFTLAENCRALRVAALFASVVALELDVARTIARHRNRRSLFLCAWLMLS